MNEINERLGEVSPPQNPLETFERAAESTWHGLKSAGEGFYRLVTGRSSSHEQNKLEREQETLRKNQDMIKKMLEKGTNTTPTKPSASWG